MNKKRLNYLIPILVLLAVGIIFAYTSQIPNPGHGADEILISVDGYTMTLQEAIDNDFLVDNGPSPTQSYTTSVSGGHSADNFFVSVNDAEMTLQNAISTVGLSSDTSSSYSSSIILGHDAEDILVEVDGSEMTLQDAINSAEFNCVAGTDIGTCRECDGTTDGEQFPIDDSACGTIDCDGKNYYFTSGSASVTGTNYCMLRDYVDITSNRCEGLGDCKDANSGDCTSYSDSTAATCGVCKYASGACSSCSNYASGTSCGTKKECNGAGSCVQFYTWEFFASWNAQCCGTNPAGLMPGGRCSTPGALGFYATSYGDCISGEGSCTQTQYRCE